MSGTIELSVDGNQFVKSAALFLSSHSHLCKMASILNAERLIICHVRGRNDLTESSEEDSATILH